MTYPPLIKKLIGELQKLPGIGPKTAERLVFHLLKSSKEEVLELADTIRQMKETVQKCRYCFNLTEQDPCLICSNPQRDNSMICVVEQPKDLLAIEKTSHYLGLYHVLMGRLAPLENEHAEGLTIDALRERIANSLNSKQPVKEVIIATNPNLEGDTTALYISNMLKDYPIHISRIARGIPTGSSIEFANQAILTDALAERKPIVRS